MTTLPPSDLDSRERYRLLTGIVVPRPIAWITSRAVGGTTVNLAPFSCFTFLCYDPMLVGFVAGRKGAQRKDTAANVTESGEFVLHIPDRGNLEAVHLSAIEHEPHVSEVEVLGLPTVDSETVGVPRLAGAPVALECHHHRTVVVGEIRSELIIGEVTRVHLRDGLIRDGKVETTDLDPLARIGGPRYATLGDITTMPPNAASLAERSASGADRGGL